MALLVILIVPMDVCTLCLVKLLVHIQYLITAQGVTYLVATVKEVVEPLETCISQNLASRQ